MPSIQHRTSHRSPTSFMSFECLDGDMWLLNIVGFSFNFDRDLIAQHNGLWFTQSLF
jgi:hypothetical protein